MKNKAQTQAACEILKKDLDFSIESFNALQQQGLNKTELLKFKSILDRKGKQIEKYCVGSE